MSSSLAGVLPAVIKSYDKNARLCRLDIPALTGGGDVYPTAEIIYPIGDKSQTRDGVVTTEIEILEGDPVWVMFINGDPASPIILGARNPRSGNDVDYRRYHHENIQLIANALLKLNADAIEITADGTLKINAANVEITASGDVKINSATLTHGGKNIGKTHTHSGVQSGSSNTGQPI